MEIPFIPHEPELTSPVFSKLEKWTQQAIMVMSRYDVDESKKKEIVAILRAIQPHVTGASDAHKKVKKTEQLLEGMSAVQSEADDELLRLAPMVSDVKLKKQSVESTIRESHLKISSARHEAQLAASRSSRMQATNDKIRHSIEQNAARGKVEVEKVRGQLEKARLMYENSPYTLKKKQEEKVVEELSSRRQHLLDEQRSLSLIEQELDNELEAGKALPFAKFVLTLAKNFTKSLTLLKKRNEAKSTLEQFTEMHRSELANADTTADFDLSASFDQEALSVSQNPAPPPPPAPVRRASSSGGPPAISSNDFVASKQLAVSQYVASVAAISQSVAGADNNDGDDPDTDMSKSRDENDCDSIAEPRESEDSNDMEVVSSNDEDGGQSPRNQEDDVNETVLEDAVEVESTEKVDDVVMKETSENNVHDKESNEDDNGMECDVEGVEEGGVEDDQRMEENSDPVPEARSTVSPQEPATSTQPASQPTQQVSNTGSEPPATSQPDSGFDFDNVSAIGTGVGDLFANSAAPDFDTSAVLNMSVNSNDPAGDFLSMMQSSTNKNGEDAAAGTGTDFSFSMFGGGSSDPPAAGGGDFGFNFGAGSPPAGGNTSFNFNFGGESEAAPESGGGGDGGFFFGF